MRWLPTLAKELERPLSKLYNFSFPVFFTFIIRFDLLVCNHLNHLHYFLGLSYEVNKLLILGFQQLKEGPDCNVLEGSISTGQEAFQVSMNTTIRLCPVLDEYRIVTN